MSSSKVVVSIVDVNERSLSRMSVLLMPISVAAGACSVVAPNSAWLAHLSKAASVFVPFRLLRTLTKSVPRMFVVPSQMLRTLASRYRRDTLMCCDSSLSRYPTPPRASMHSCRPAMDVLAVRALMMGVKILHGIHVNQ